MGIGGLLGRFGNIIRGGGRLLKNVVSKGAKIFGKISPYIKKGIDIGSKFGSFINDMKQRRDDASGKIDDIVNQLPDRKIKDKIRNVVDKGKEASDRILNKGYDIADKSKPWVDFSRNMYGRIKPSVM